MGRAPAIFFEQRMSEPEHFETEAGRASVFSTSSPASDDRANQDSALSMVAGDAVVLAVADGAGGLPAGGRASRLAIECLEAAIDGSTKELRSRILDGFDDANRAVLDLGLGAGTTLVAVEIRGSVLRTYHVGDSQALVVGQRGKRKKVTLAHGPVGYQVEAGVLDHSEAMHHEDLAVVTNLVGTADMRIELGAPLELAPLDTVVLGSDGLFDNLTLDVITDIVKSGPLEEVATELVRRCLARMSSDKGHPDDLTWMIFRPGK
jgi:serine/threonine protein phosphatase PrpC